MKKIFVSVIIPVYNVEDYLSTCIDSVLEQSHKELEVILVDDGSTDKSGKICDAYRKEDSRVRVIHKENGGLSDARNAGIEIAQGSYISFVDSDDYVHKDFIKTLLKACKEYSAEIAVCRHFKFCSDAELLSCNKKDFCGLTLLDKKRAFRAFLLNQNGDFVVTWNKLYAARLWKYIRFPKGKIHEDCFVSHQLYLDSDKIIYLDDILYGYRSRPSSIIKSADAYREYAAVEAYEMLLKLTAEKYPEYIRLAEAAYMHANLGVLNKCTKKDSRFIKLCRTNLQKIKYRHNPYISFLNRVRIFVFILAPSLYIRLNGAILQVL